jgi:ATP-dependent DNA ligase
MFSAPVAIARGFGLSGGKKPAATSFPHSTYSADLVTGVTNTQEQFTKDKNGFNILSVMNKQMDKDGWWLDGELYSHELEFDRISGLARKKNRTQAEDEDTMKLGYRVYDFFSAPSEDFYTVAYDNGYVGDPEDLVNDYKLEAIHYKSPYSVRYGLLALIYRLNQIDKVPSTGDPKEVITSLANSAVELTDNIYVLKEDQLETIHDLFVEEGYEGLMLRNIDAPYEFSRSWNLVKYKVMKDDEFKIVDAVKGLKGKSKGAIIWICETPKGDRFNVVPNGTMASRKILWDEWKADPKEFIGKELTVQYQELSPKGIPRFPKGLGIRDYE